MAHQIMTINKTNVFISPNYIKRDVDLQSRDRGVFDLFARDEKSLDELHVFAEKFGIKRKLFNITDDAYPYRYVIDAQFRQNVIHLGAIEATEIQIKVFEHYWWEMHLRNRF